MSTRRTVDIIDADIKKVQDANPAWLTDKECWKLISNLIDEKKIMKQEAVSVEDEEFNVKVYFGKASKIVNFTSYEDFIDKIEIEWKSLKQFNYLVSIKLKNGKILSFTSVEQIKKDCRVIIHKLSKGFSKYRDEDEVLAYIGVMMMSTNYFSSKVGDPDFPVVPSEVVSPEKLNIIVAVVIKELELRRDVIQTHNATEYSMREFISPILISSVKIMIDYLKQKDISEGLSLSCEKKIIGNMYYGPVDYSVVFDCLDIVLTEAKWGSSELKDGILQNILQQRSAKEFLAKVVVNPSLTGESRKRKFEENFRALIPLPSYGIVSDGTNWIFTKTVYNSVTGRTHILQSSAYNVLPQLAEQNIKNLISRIVGIIHLQLQEIKSNEIYQQFKHSRIESTDGTLRREVTVAAEITKEMDEIFEETEIDDFNNEDDDDEDEVS